MYLQARLKALGSPWTSTQIDRRAYSESEISSALDAVDVYTQVECASEFAPDWQKVFELLYRPSDEFDPETQQADGSKLTWRESALEEVRIADERGETVELTDFLQEERTTPSGTKTDLSKITIRDLATRIPLPEVSARTVNKLLQRWDYPAAQLFDQDSPEFEEIHRAIVHTATTEITKSILTELKVQTLGPQNSARIADLLRNESARALAGETDWSRAWQIEMVIISCSAPRYFIPALEGVLESLAAAGQDGGLIRQTLELIRS